MINFCSLTISEYLHSYKQFDYNTNHIFNVYEKYIQNKNGGFFKEFGNNKYKYDFEILDNQIFLGNRNNCVHILIEKNIARIQFFGFQKYCSKNKNLEKNIGTKHMFLWTLIVILKYFNNVNLIELGDDSKIDCNSKKKHLSKYYFLKYGKQYYEKYFNFKPFFNNNKHRIRYKNNLLKRYNLEISISQLKNTYKENNYKNKIIYNKFKKIFGENNKISLINLFKKTPKSLQYKYCDFFFDLIDDIFEENFYNTLGETFRYKITNKHKFLSYLKNKIQKL